MTIQEKIQRALEIANKWEDPNVGATTEELKELRLLASDIQREASEYVAMRIEDEASNGRH